MQLLPPNSTTLEKGIVGAFADALNDKEILIKNLWNADECPEEFLPYLASFLSVDFEVYGILTLDQKREHLKKSVEIHRKKGSLGALKAALSTLNYKIKVVEWYNNGGKPHTFNLKTSKSGAGEFDIPLLRKLVQKNKNVQSQFSLTIEQETRSQLHAGLGITQTIKVR
jgi:phage tail P2-like protein